MILKVTSLVGTERLGASIGGGVGSGLGLDLGRTDGSFWFWWQTGEVALCGVGDTAGDVDGLGEDS